jgi:hypothetical protein
MACGPIVSALTCARAHKTGRSDVVMTAGPMAGLLDVAVPTCESGGGGCCNDGTHHQVVKGHLTEVTSGSGPKAGSVRRIIACFMATVVLVLSYVLWCSPRGLIKRWTLELGCGNGCSLGFLAVPITTIKAAPTTNQEAADIVLTARMKKFQRTPQDLARRQVGQRRHELCRRPSRILKGPSRY